MARVYFCIILIVTILVYYPSFSLFFGGGDISKYFLETQNSSFRELMTNYLSWSAVTKYARGDTFSFRPLSVMFLAVEKYFFGARYVLWQLAHIILHLGVVLCLYRLLMGIRRHIFAWLLCFLFSVYTIFVQVVTWTMFANYFLYLALVLTALYYLYRYTFGEKKARYNLFLIFLCMLFGCFLYETGIIFCLLFVAYLAILSFQQKESSRKRDFTYLIILIPVFIFLLAYFINLYYGRSWLMAFETKRLFSFKNILETIIVVPKIFFLWIGRGFFLSYTGGRFTSSLFTFVVRYALLFFSILYLCIALRISSNRIKKNWLFMVLILSMMTVHVGINCFGRMSTHGIRYLLATKQTAYMFWALLIVLISLAIDFARLKTYNKLIYHIGVVGLSLFILFNVGATYGINRIMQAEQRDVTLYTDQLYRFIEEHRREDDFSFAVASPTPWVFTVTDGYIDPKGAIVKGVNKEFSIHEIFFGEYYNKKDPKYVLQYDLIKNKLKIEKKEDDK